MPDFCSCGAQLPEDALFCHKCGKPQRDLVEVEAPEPAPAIVAQVPPAVAPPRIAIPLGFRNPIALRVALLSAIGAFIFNFLPFVNWIAAGFFAVFFYRRKTRDLLDVGAGLQIGWITGLITFTVEGVYFVTVSSTGLLSQAKLDQMKGWPMANDPNFSTMVHFLSSPPGMIFFLICIFVFIVALTMAGGALGAKLVGRG